MIDKIVEILKEKDFKLVEDNLSRFKEADHFSLVYLLRNIIIEKWVSYRTRILTSVSEQYLS